MKKLSAAAIAAVCVAASPAVASASPIRECGNIAETPGRVFGSPAGIVNLTTRNVACGYARGFSIQVTKHNDRFFQGFECHRGALGMYEIDIRCVKGPDVIHWQIGD